MNELIEFFLDNSRERVFIDEILKEIKLKSIKDDLNKLVDFGIIDVELDFRYGEYQYSLDEYYKDNSVKALYRKMIKINYKKFLNDK